MEGHVDPAFSNVADQLEKFVADDGVGGGSVAVYHRGKPVVDVWTGARDKAGNPWLEDTLAMAASTTKPFPATALHMCKDRGLLDWDDPIAKHWPEFAQNGKENITIRHALTHEAGLWALRDVVEDASDISNWDLMCERLAAATPRTEPGIENAYHAVTYGFLVGEIVRRVDGRTVGTVIAEDIAEPLGLDGAFVGLPKSEVGRLAEAVVLREDPFSAEKADVEEGPIAKMAAEMGISIDFEAIDLALPGDILANWSRRDDAKHVEMPAGNGIFSARSLARFYACWINDGELDGVRLLEPETVAEATRIQNHRPDRVIVLPPLWRLGFHQAMTTRAMPPQGFGHNGLGGSGAFGDPATGITMGMLVNRMGVGMTGDTRVAEMGAVALECAHALES